MELRLGYKQTEVGVFPEGWNLRPISKFSAFVTKGATPTTYGFQWEHDGVIFLRSECVSDHGLDLAQAMFISLEAHAALVRGEVRSGDILITITGNVGRVIQLPPDFGYANINQHIARIRVNDPNVNPGFVYHYLSQPSIRVHYVSITTGQAYPQISLVQVRETLIPLPKPSEQHAIAVALGDVDALLNALEKLIAKKRDLKQATMQQLLTGQTRLPGFTGEWEVKRLGQLFNITSSKRVFQSEWKTEGIPFYRARELAILGEKGCVDNELFISNALYDAYRKAHGVPQVGDMLVTGVGTLGKVYVVTNDREFYFKDGNIIWFKIGGKVSPQFLRQLYLTQSITKQITDTSAGTTVGTYTISGAKRTLIPLPPLPEQTAIAEVLSDMDAEIAALEQRLAKSRALKQGMMQELLTGKTRLI